MYKIPTRGVARYAADKSEAVSVMPKVEFTT